MTTEPMKLCWVDIETGGLSLTDDIVEFAMIITDARPPFTGLAAMQAVIRPDDGWEARMDPFCVTMHRKSGLYGNIAHGLSLADVDVEAAVMLDAHDTGQQYRLAGSGVSHFDHGMIKAHMPELASRLAYATLDVGVVRRAFEAVGRKDVVESTVVPPEEDKAHRAMADIQNHLDEWRQYAPILESVRLT